MSITSYYIQCRRVKGQWQYTLATAEGSKKFLSLEAFLRELATLINQPAVIQHDKTTGNLYL